MKTEAYELDDLDRALLLKVRKAVEYENEGGPAKDAIDESEMVDGLRLLIDIIDAGFAK